MHIAVRQGVDKINSLQADSLLSEEIDLELNKNMSRFINLKYGKNNQYGKGFEESQKRIDDLSTLVEEHRGFTGFIDRELLAYYETSSESSGKYLYREFYTLPHNYMHHIESTTNVLRNSSATATDFRLEYYNDADYIANQGYEDYAKYFVIPFNALEVKDASGTTIAAKSKFVIRRGAKYTPDSVSQEQTIGAYPEAGNNLSANVWEADVSTLDIPFDEDLQVISNPNNIYKDYIINYVLTNHSNDVIIRWEKSGTLSYPNSFIIILKPDTDLYTWVRSQEEAANLVQILDNISGTDGFDEGGSYVTTNALYSSIVNFESTIVVESDVSVEGDFDFIDKTQVVETDFIVGYKRKFNYAEDTKNASALNSNPNSSYWNQIEGIGREFEGLNVPITYVQHDDLQALLKDPFNRPGKSSVIGVFSHKFIELYTLSSNKFTRTTIIPDSLKLKYLRTPLPMSLTANVDCELPAHTHEEIVAMTVSGILEGISDPRYKTHMSELIRQE